MFMQMKQGFIQLIWGMLQFDQKKLSIPFG